MTITTESVRSFLDGHRLAVVGASDSKDNFARTICRALTDHGYDVVPVHRTADTVDGLRCYPRLGDIPDPVDGVIVMVQGDEAAPVIDDAADAGVERVWLFKGIGGAGAVSPQSLAACERHRMLTVAGACPLMFLEPVAAVHRVHRSVRRLRGAIERVGV